jgi:enoyl-CoA hydratase/carnithine racemase
MTIHYQKNDKVGVFTIDNGPLNILTPALHKQLFQLLKDFLIDPDVNVGVLMGSAGNSFCAGDNIKLKLPERSKQEELEAYLFLHQNELSGGEPQRPGWEVDVLQLERYKPIIGAVDGYCLGQGMVYLSCLTDIRIATPTAKMGLPEVAYGMGGGGGMTRLGHQLPHAVAMWHLLTGEPMTAAQALAHHFINEIVQPEHLLSRALEVAALIARHPPVAVRVEMEAYYKSLDLPHADNLRYVNNLYRLQRMGFEGYGAGTDFLKKNDA